MSSTEPNQDTTSTVNLADEEGVKRILVRSIFNLWDAVNELARIRPTKNDRYRVTIFGSARAAPGSLTYEETKRAAAALASWGCDIITGGGPGLMQAANEGAASAPERVQSLGIRIDLPFEQQANAFVSQVFTHRTFFTRLHHFVLNSDAYIVAPGGIGTVLETMMIWQLLQVRHLHNTPLILVGRIWPGLIQWCRDSMLSFEPPLASADDIAIPQCVPTADDAIALVRPHFERWRRGH